MTVRRKCFVSYHQNDEAKVRNFINHFSDVFIAKELGVTDDDDFIDSDDTDYVMRRIRELNLTDSTVTIVMVGACTWARRYVDWEVASTLRNDANNKRSGLLAIQLPGGKKLPARVADNVKRDSAGRDIGYARYITYPETLSRLRNMIEEVSAQRDEFPVNTRDLPVRNSAC